MGIRSVIEPHPVVFDRIARIAAATAKADVAFITLRVDHKLSIIGTFGIYLHKTQGNWDQGFDLVRRTSMSYIANVARDPNFKNHPLLKAAPYTRTLVHVPVQGRHADIEAAISLVNVGMKWPLSAATTAILTDLAMLVGDTLRHTNTIPDSAATPASASDTPQRGLMEAAPATPPAKLSATDTATDTAGQFLFATLKQKTSIRNRKDVSYITLRNWSATIKDHQIKALRIAKLNPDPQFVEDIADEICTQVRKLFGKAHFDGVAPVPCGHSKGNTCLSVLVSKKLASKLDVAFIDALRGVKREGSSHPAKNADLKKPKLATKQRYNSVLLVDDVATSGRHIELSVQALSEIAQHVTAIAWIGSV